MPVNWPAGCAVIIPCHNEAKAIEPLVRQIRVVLPQVIVVDDGSDDGTSLLAETAGARVIRHKGPEGKGAALNTGWRAARESGFLWTLSMDGDGQHSPADIPLFLIRAEAGTSPLIVGNRMIDPAPMPALRRMVNRWMSHRLSHLTGCLLPDSQCGFRLMRLDVWAEMSFQTRHFEIESELLVEFARRGHPIDFVPITVIYRDEGSKIRPGNDTVRWLRWWWHARRVKSPPDRKPGTTPACAPVT